jgi:hypothetical protein
MIKEATIVRPARLEGLYNTNVFIPPNSKDHLIEVDMGFKINPVFRQEKLCYFLPENIYYQKLSLVDGKMNAIRDDARTIVITGQVEESNLINFKVAMHPRLPEKSNIDTEFILLPFYPEMNTEIVIRDRSSENTFYHFSCNKIIHKAGALPYLELRCLNSYYHTNLATVLRKWHPNEITLLHNIPHR